MDISEIIEEVSGIDPDISVGKGTLIKGSNSPTPYVYLCLGKRKAYIDEVDFSMTIKQFKERYLMPNISSLQQKSTR